MIHTSEQIDAISAALVKAQAEIENVPKDRENPHFRAKYATLAGVLDEARPKFAKHGIYIMQAPINGEGSNIGVVTRLLHSSGQFIESTLYVAPTKFDAQGAGSALTYLRRYALMAMAGIAPEDDDGNAAVSRPEPQRAGIVRAADVPPRQHVREAWDDERPSQAQKKNGNGKPLAPAELFRNDMLSHFARAKTPDDVRKLLADTKADLEAVLKDAPAVYDEIIAAATNATNAMYGETG